MLLLVASWPLVGLLIAIIIIAIILILRTIIVHSRIVIFIVVSGKALWRHAAHYKPNALTPIIESPRGFLLGKLPLLRPV